MQEAAFLTTLIRVVGALNQAAVPYALTGGAAVYAHGGPHSDHDIDVLVEPGEVDRAITALTELGMSAAQPPEDWLCKAYDGDVLVDLIHRIHGSAVTREFIDGTASIRVGSVAARVVSATEMLVQKLLVLDCHRCDFANLLLIAKILREKIDWPQLRSRTAGSPFARAFSELVSGLGVVDGDEFSTGAPPVESSSAGSDSDQLAAAVWAVR